MQLEDSLFQFFGLLNDLQSEEVTFLEQKKMLRINERILPEIPLKDRVYISIYLRSDSIYRVHKRSAETLMDYLGDVGGVLEIITLIGFFMITPFIERSLKSDMINEVYQV